MNEQQQHLKQLLQQRNNINIVINQNKELYWKVQGAIEYLIKMGVTLPESESETDTSDE